MAFYRTVSLSFWTDSKVDDEFTPEDKYFYLYLLTNPHTNICGCYEVGKRQIERETGYTWDTVARLLYRMEHVHNVIRYDADTKEILVLHWNKYNWNGNAPTVITAVLRAANVIKNEAFRDYVLALANGEETETEAVTESVTVTDISISHPYPMDRVSKPRKRFTPPTIDEVIDYCNERGGKVDAHKWYDHYSSNGWMVGKNHMKDWKAAVRTWERNSFGSEQKQKGRYDWIDSIDYSGMEHLV